MTITKSVDTTSIQAGFTKFGYSNEELCSILFGLVTIWRVNDLIEDITREVVMSELGEDEVTAGYLWNAVSKGLVEIGKYIRDFSQKYLIERWAVTPFAILLEYEDYGKPTDQVP